MREVRKSLMRLMGEAAEAYQMEHAPPRLQAAMLHEAMAVLPLPGRAEARRRVTARLLSLSHGSLHRHLLTIRCPDQAFYFGAIKGYLSRRGIQPIGHQTLVASLHCDERHCRLLPCEPGEIAEDNFMLIAIHLSATLIEDARPLLRDVHWILQAVEVSVRDFPAMRQCMRALADTLDAHNRIESELLRWMLDDRYIMYGMQRGSWRRGVMRNRRLLERIVPGLREQIAHLSPASSPGLEWLPLSSALNHIYTPARMEVVRICWPERDGSLHECLLLGHFSRSGRYTNASEVPRLREGWHALRYSRMLRYSSFYRRELRSLYDRMPKPVLLAVPGVDWVRPLKEITDLSVPTRMSVTRLQPEQGDVEYLLMAMMNDRFGPNIMAEIRRVLRQEGLRYHDHIAITMGEKRILVAAVAAPDGWPEPGRLHARLQECIVFWKDRAKRHVLARADRLHVPEALAELEQVSRLYQELYPPEQFVRDLQAAREIRHRQRHLVRVELQGEMAHLHVYTHSNIPLGRLIEQVHAFGLLAEQESLANFGDGRETIRLITLQCRVPAAIRVQALPRLQKALEHVFNHEADHDALNALVITAGLEIREVAVLIALRNHLIQLLPDAAPGPLSEMMKRYPKVSACLYRIFEALHRPAMPPTASAQRTLAFTEALRTVGSLTHDRWFRALQGLVLASLRTNAYVRAVDAPLAIKVDPSAMDFVPRPRPFREIFVHGIHVEGVHLRAGAVARGGIRHSDRHNDYRTEILELMATQTVKNGQILPTGAKGGFIVRGTRPDAAFVLRQYRLFIRALLTLTDNLVEQQVVPPEGIRVATVDRDDPYLVVAPDKGTARFSDDANEEARNMGFWLDDAFASGGGDGYDHKAFGITARGAWVCAESHFRQLGRDASRDPISIVGIGDMSGDVFGNGMLLNPHIRLLAAFNHRHIFLDPNPDAAQAFAERQRLFREGLGWDGYDPALISHGGGVFDRDSKQIPISQEVRAALGIDVDALPGESLIRAVLRAPVDLLYNGGIGTYVKSRQETHRQVRDPSNDAVRVDAQDLRCSVVCEGGNLGFTQWARLEYARKGGLIYTDAIDNAAGVNMSDHEVNLKILFSATSASGIGRAARNRLLARVAGDVMEQCLQANARQAMALELAQLDARAHLPRYVRLRDGLLEEKRLDLRVDPGMHDEQTLHLAPQLAVLLGHEKNRIHDALNREGYAQWSLFADSMLREYFPLAIRRRFADAIAEHPLRVSLAHTCITNHVLDHYGLACVHHLQSMIGCAAADACEALLIAERLLHSQPVLQALSRSRGDVQVGQQIQHGIQEYHLLFAEELLRLCRIRELDDAWLRRHWRGLRRFCRSDAVMGIGGNENSRFLHLLREAALSGLDKQTSADLAMLPELAQMAPAIHLSTQLQSPLKHCLRAMQAVLHLLPFSAIEMPMRSAEWGSGEAHLLRREWFHRLTLLKARAGACLLRRGKGDPLALGEQCWSRHRHWPSLQEFALESAQRLDAAQAGDEYRTQLMLMMAKLETLVEECGSCVQVAD